MAGMSERAGRKQDTSRGDEGMKEEGTEEDR